MSHHIVNCQNVPITFSFYSDLTMKVMQLPPDISKTTLSPQSVGLAGFEPMAGSFTLWFIEEKNTAIVFCHSSSLRKEIQEINWKRKTEQVRFY